METFDVGFRVIVYLFRLRDNVLEETYRILNLIDEWSEECAKEKTEEMGNLTQGKIATFFEHFYDGQYQQENVETGYAERTKLMIKPTHEEEEEEIFDENIDQDIMGSEPHTAKVKARAVLYQGNKLVHEGRYHKKRLVGVTTEYLPETDESIITLRGLYRDGLREGWFKRFCEQNSNEVEEYTYYVKGLRNNYSFTISNQLYSTCNLDDKNCCCNIEEYPKKKGGEGEHGEQTGKGKGEVVKKRISRINHYVNDLLEGYQFTLCGDGSIDQIDFYNAGELIPSKGYKFLGANIYVPLEV